MENKELEVRSGKYASAEMISGGWDEKYGGKVWTAIRDAYVAGALAERERQAYRECPECKGIEISAVGFDRIEKQFGEEHRQLNAENAKLRAALVSIDELDGEFGTNMLPTDCSEADGFRQALAFAREALGKGEE